MTEPSPPGRPSVNVLKQLFAHSGNRCAFPACTFPLVQDGIVIGEVCHIKAASPRGPRFDREQESAERHAYANLLLLCPVHHKIIDDDPDSYTVKRLTAIKDAHAANSADMPELEAEGAAVLLTGNLVASASQSGGITANTVHQVFNLHPLPANLATEERQREARRQLAPELQRTIERVHWIHGRAIANFICYSAASPTKPNDKKEDFIPYWPALYPTAPQVRDLGGEDGAALVAFYDSLHSLADDVKTWWDREDQLPVNIFNSFLHHASRSLRLALLCIERFNLEVLFPPPHEAWGSLSSRIGKSLEHEESARRHHIARFEAKSKVAATRPTVRRSK